MKGKSKLILRVSIGLLIICYLSIGIWILVDIASPSDDYIDARLKQNFSYELDDVMWLDPKSMVELTTFDRDVFLVFTLSLTNHTDNTIRFRPSSWDLVDDKGSRFEAILSDHTDPTFGSVFLDVQPRSSIQVTLGFYLKKLTAPLSLDYEGDMILQIPLATSQPVIVESGR